MKFAEKEASVDGRKKALSATGPMGGKAALTALSAPIARQSKAENRKLSKAVTGFLDEPRRVTLVAKGENGNSIITQHLPPILIGDQFVYQIVVDAEDERGNRRVEVVTKNDEGQVIATEQIDPAYLTESFTNEVTSDRRLSFNNQPIPTLVTYNAQGKIAAMVPVENLMRKTSRKSLQNCELVVDPRNNLSLQASTCTKHADTLVALLRPVFCGNQYYRQIITTTADEIGNKLSILQTKNEAGVIVDVREVDSQKLSNTQCSELVEERVDVNGRRVFKLATVNDLNEVLAVIEIFVDLNETCKGDYREIIEQIVDKAGNQLVTAVTTNEEGEPVVVSQQVCVENSNAPQAPVVLFAVDHPSLDKQVKPYDQEPSNSRRESLRSAQNANGIMDRIYSDTTKKHDPFKRYSLYQNPDKANPKTKKSNSFSKAAKGGSLRKTNAFIEESQKEVPRNVLSERESIISKTSYAHVVDHNGNIKEPVIPEESESSSDSSSDSGDEPQDPAEPDRKQTTESKQTPNKKQIDPRARMSRQSKDAKSSQPLDRSLSNN